jgi:EpsI family protein
MNQHMRHAQLRFYLLVLLLVIAALFLRSHSRAEVLPPRDELGSFPVRVAAWTGRDIVISEETRRILGDGEFLHRVYRSSQDEAAVEFFLAFFPSQRTGSSIHSPKNCLPGAGWVPVESSHVALERPGGKRAYVNRFIIQKGTNRQLVLYWYQSHDRVVASEYWAKFYLVADAIHLNRSDGSLVRVITPLTESESIESGERRARDFAAGLWPILDHYIPR